MGEGFNKAAYGFGVLNGELYACGEFTASGNTLLGGVSRWDGNQWVNPGFMLGPEAPGQLWYVHTLHEINNRLYILGGFKRAVLQNDTLACSAVVAFDGEMLDVMNGGLPNVDAEAILPYEQGILIGGGIINGNSGHLHYYTSFVSFNSDIQDSTSVTISPNPASDVITLRISDTRMFHYEWYNAMGQQLSTGKSTGPETTWHIKDWQPGMYYLKIWTPGTNPVVQPIIKQ